jgi:lysyl endopeptidase
LVISIFQKDRSYLFIIRNKTQIIGAFSSHNNKESRSLATALIHDDYLTVEYYESAKSLGQGTLEISQVAHGYRGWDENINRIDESGGCQVNVNCSPKGDGIWQDHKKGVARIVINGGGLCTGSLVNNTDNDCTPYFLTADHCIDGTYDAITAPNANIVFY